MSKKKILENEKLKAVMAIKLLHLVSLVTPKRNELIWFSMPNECKSELKNKKPMEINEDTRIKDLIPEGYELETKILKDVNLGIFGEYINIPVKKKEVKDFDWYAQRYFDKIKKRLRIELIINSDFADVDFPFEFKIGLLKFICDDLGVNVEAFIIAKSFGGGGSYAKVEGICPPEFLNSIFK